MTPVRWLIAGAALLVGLEGAAIVRASAGEPPLSPPSCRGATCLV